MIDLAQAMGQDWYYETAGDAAKEMIENVGGYKSLDLAKLYPQFVLQDEQVVA